MGSTMTMTRWIALAALLYKVIAAGFGQVPLDDCCQDKNPFYLEQRVSDIFCFPYLDKS
jgi:hypothetical protein